MKNLSKNKLVAISLVSILAVSAMPFTAFAESSPKNIVDITYDGTTFDYVKTFDNEVYRFDKIKDVKDFVRTQTGYTGGFDVKYRLEGEQYTNDLPAIKNARTKTYDIKLIPTDPAENDVYIVRGVDLIVEPLDLTAEAEKAIIKYSGEPETDFTGLALTELTPVDAVADVNNYATSQELFDEINNAVTGLTFTNTNNITDINVKGGDFDADTIIRHTDALTPSQSTIEILGGKNNYVNVIVNVSNADLKINTFAEITLADGFGTEILQNGAYKENTTFDFDLSVNPFDNGRTLLGWEDANGNPYSLDMTTLGRKPDVTQENPNYESLVLTAVWEALPVQVQHYSVTVNYLYDNNGTMENVADSITAYEGPAGAYDISSHIDNQYDGFTFSHVDNNASVNVTDSNVVVNVYYTLNQIETFTDITDEQVPLVAPLDEVIVDEEVPLVAPLEEVIVDEEVPLAPSEDLTIQDEEVPLAVPTTNDKGLDLMVPTMAITMLAGVAAFFSRKKKDVK